MQEKVEKYESSYLSKMLFAGTDRYFFYYIFFRLIFYFFVFFISAKSGKKYFLFNLICYFFTRKLILCFFSISCFVVISSAKLQYLFQIVVLPIAPMLLVLVVGIIFYRSEYLFFEDSLNILLCKKNCVTKYCKARQSAEVRQTVHLPICARNNYYYIQGQVTICRLCASHNSKSLFLI